MNSFDNSKLKIKNLKIGSLLKKNLLLRFFIFNFSFLIAVSPAFAKWEQQQVAMETNLQQKIETILSKALPVNSYIVTVHVEMEDKPNESRTVRNKSKTGNNPFLNNNRFILPGVPQKKEFSNNDTQQEDTVSIDATPEPQVKKIGISILVSQSTTQEQIKTIRDLLSSSLPFDPVRGDELDIQPSNLINGGSQEPQAPMPTPIASTPGDLSPVSKPALNVGGLLSSLSVPIVALLSIIAGILLTLVVFLFGPVRGFLNRLLVVLPRVGEQAAYSNTTKPNQTASADLQATREKTTHQFRQEF